MLADSPSSTSSMSRKSSPSKPDAPMENPTVKSFSVIRRGQSSPSKPPLAPPQAPERPADTLKVVVGDKGRRSRCAPEFLHEVATAKYIQHDLLQDLGRKFKIIAGKEAVGFYKRFLKRKEPSPDKATEEPAPQVVFAVTVTDTGRKLVDYYLTWRGKTRAQELRGSKRKVDFLDSEFRKVARTLDKEFKRASVYGSVTSVAGSSHSSRKPIDSPPENPRPRPPTVVIPPPGEKHEPSPDVPPPRSATDSVTSLPVLSYVRGVPFGNRMPLTVMNPDRLSTISSDSVQTLIAEKIASGDKPLASVTEEPPTAPSPAPSPLATFSPPGRTETLSSRSTTPQSEASAEAPSLKNVSSHSKPKPDSKSHSESSEFLIVCLDEMIDKNGPTWHGLERQTSRNSTRSLPTRISPWDGPLARANGITYRTPPIRRASSVKAKIWAADGSSSSSSEEEWENEPVIPFEPFIVPALPSEAPPSRVASPVSMGMGVQYGPGAMPTLSSSYASPMVSVRNLNVGYPSVPAYGSPYAQAQANHLPSSPYVSPYVSPNMPLHRSLSQSTYSGYSPYVS